LRFILDNIILIKLILKFTFHLLITNYFYVAVAIFFFRHKYLFFVRQLFFIIIELNWDILSLIRFQIKLSLSYSNLCIFYVARKLFLDKLW